MNPKVFTVMRHVDDVDKHPIYVFRSYKSNANNVQIGFFFVFFLLSREILVDDDNQREFRPDGHKELCLVKVRASKSEPSKYNKRQSPVA